MAITAEQAQANLEAKRKELGINPSTPSTLSETISEVVEKIPAPMSLIVPGECYRHKKPEPCPDCEEEDKQRREWAAEQERKRQELYAAEREAIIREREDHPEIILSKVGVGKRHLSCSFDSYKGGEKIKAICKQFVSDPFDIVLFGGAGSGKTHLAIAMLRELVRSGKIVDGQVAWGDNKYKGGFASVPQLLADIRATFGTGNGDEQEIIDNYSNLQYLVLDDLGAEKSTEWSITTLYLIIDRRYRDMLPTIITTNLTMEEIGQHISRRIASRLSSGKVIEVKAPDYRMKRA